MADYFLSDVHLRHDRPDRGLRLARLVDRLGFGDRLVVVGDLCDFWLASRERGLDPRACPGLRSLIAYRDRGGRPTILAGNHDRWLGPFYERVLGADWVEDDLGWRSYGIRAYLAHGHRLGARTPWKAAMESRGFLHAFGAAPGRLAAGMERRLDERNEASRAADDDRGLAAYRKFARGMAGSVDLVVLGHVHREVDEPGMPRLVVLGGWHSGGGYLKVDEGGASSLEA